MSQPALGSILMAEDEVELREALRDQLTSQQYAVVAVASGKEALARLEDQSFDLLLSDLMMPDLDGLELLRKALILDPQLVGIIMTGQGSIPTAIEAMKIGAFDYVLKPYKMQQLLPILSRAMEVRRLRMENIRLRQYVERLTFESPRYHMVGSGPAMQRVLQLIEKVAASDVTVLVQGETGSGKELVARALHHNSDRRNRPMVTINCAALQETLLESELFGYDKGAFTGAVQAKQGLVEVANGGTLFIDEVAEMAPGMQAKLLRVLENGNYRRVGGTQEHHADIRLIAATNKPLIEEQKAGRFREDLFYRLNVVTIIVPPLRERREDIPLLVDHFLTTRQLGKRKCKVDPSAMAAITHYAWPGNVRELVNVLERAQILAEDQLITIDDLPENMVTEAAVSAEPAHDDSLRLRDVERRHVRHVLAQAQGNKLQAAKTLGISRRALYRLIEKYGLETKST